MALVALVFQVNRNRTYQMTDGTRILYPAIWRLYLPILLLLFFVGLRDEVLDTYAYINSFLETPNNFKSAVAYALSFETGQLFYLIQGVFKTFISENHYLWLAFVGGLSLYCLYRQYRKHSPDYTFSFFLLVSSTTFTWLINGTRQFVVVCFLFALSDLIVRKEKRCKFIYLFLIVVLYYAHSSCLFLLPLVYLCSRGKLLDKWMFIIVIATVFATMYSDSILGAASDIMNKQYTMGEGKGSSIPRLLVSLVPLALVLLKWKLVKEKASPFIVFSINMSLVGACFFFAATFTNGILVGRMPIYFTLYDYILLPWLIKNFYNRGIVKIACVVFYTVFFYYQMVIAWHDLPYVSKILGIYYY